MRVIVTDDEELAREALVTLLKDIEGITIVGMCDNGIDTIKKVKSLNPDILFLDIKMPQVNGFEVLELLGKEAPPTVFVTAYDDFAVKAFEANATDYLLKPVNFNRLLQSIEKIKSRTGIPDYQNILKEQRDKIENINRFLIREGNNVHVIPIKDILWLEAQDDYVAIITESNLFLKSDRLNNLEKRLNHAKFKRIHRSYIVNMDYVLRIENQKWAVLNNGKKLPVSKSGYVRFFD
jgi:two-component system LytT family response regulator